MLRAAAEPTEDSTRAAASRSPSTRSTSRRIRLRARLRTIVIGATHHRAPLAIRERLSLSADAAAALQNEFATLPGLKEFAVLNTCNRVEFYGVAASADAAAPPPVAGSGGPSAPDGAGADGGAASVGGVFRVVLVPVAYGADGLCIETHVSPSHGIGDDPKQSLTPDVLAETIAQAKQVWALRRPAKVA